jgi:hypothetical protein
MSSWLKCTCGKTLHTNLFAGAPLSILVPEAALNRDLGVATATALVAELVLAHPHVIECKACRRLHVRDQQDKSLYRAYVPEPDSTDDHDAGSRR